MKKTPSKNKNENGRKIVILPDIRSAYNVGSIFRTCDAAGIDAIYLVGYTPQPLDRFGRPRKDIAKVALGAEQNISWKYFKTIEECFGELSAQGFQIIAIEQDSQSIHYKKLQLPENSAFVFGNETEGLSHQILDTVDTIVEIPMQGAKESLNVGVTAGIILFHFS